MAKTRKELNTLKNEYETLANKLNELTADEIKEVIGGAHGPIQAGSGSMIHAPTFTESFSEEIKPSQTKGWFGTAICNNINLTGSTFAKTPDYTDSGYVLSGEDGTNNANRKMRDAKITDII